MPPIPNDYTVADLRSAPAECAESFEILKSLIDEDWNLPGAPAIGLTKEDVKMIGEARRVIEDSTPSQVAESLSQRAVQIEQAWARAEKARNVIHRLNEYPEIADLTEPNIDFKSMRWHNLIDLARLYQVYAYLQAESNDIHEFTVELIELDSMFRKLSLNARLFVHRLICDVYLETDLETANAIVNNPNTSSNTVELLAKQFTPLTKEQLSLRNGVLFEYLLRKDAALNVLRASHGGRTRLLKTNSTLRVFRNRQDNWLAAVEQNGHVATGLSVWPDHFPFKEPDPLPMWGALPVIYRCYNPLGSTLIHMFRLPNNADFKKRFPLPFRDDLFQIVLNKRLGKEVSLKARAYSDEYIVDVENRKIFSPGPDGKPGTKDDIKLPINPEVLGW